MNLLTRAIPLLSKVIPSGIAIKGLSKIDKRLSGFIQNSIAAGYTADNVLDYLRDRIQPEGQKSEQGRLEKRESQGNLSAQEQTALGNRRTEGKLGSAIGTGIGLATGLGGFGGEEEEIEPSTGGPPSPPRPYTPLDQLRLQRVSQNQQNKQQPPISPLQQQSPTSQQEQPPSPDQQQQPQPDQQQISPLDQFEAQYPIFFEKIKSQMANGMSPAQAVGMAVQDKQLFNVARKLEKITGMRIEDLIEKLFQGSVGEQQPQKGKGNQALTKAVENLLKM